MQGQVTDRSTAWPTPLSAGPDEGHGRGLAIVAVYTDHWGVIPAPDGKTVWFICGGSAMSAPPGSFGLAAEIG